MERANASTAPPVVLVHGLWLLPSSWDPWAAHFEENGFVALTPGWPDDPETVADTVPKAIVKASYNREKRNTGVTELVEMKGRGHAITIDSGWQEVADTALAFIRRFVLVAFVVG